MFTRGCKFDIEESFKASKCYWIIARPLSLTHWPATIIWSPFNNYCLTIIICPQLSRHWPPSQVHCSSTIIKSSFDTVAQLPSSLHHQATIVTLRFHHHRRTIANHLCLSTSQPPPSLVHCPTSKLPPYHHCGLPPNRCQWSTTRSPSPIHCPTVIINSSLNCHL